ncbi:small-conductance mechanosensitive channel [Flavobacterium sp. 7E]|uniref:mechanosensitive ion channel family protein n=1 Tax=unclassified Flavobacterium TaxID=196869 RepID=UPI0015705258|nr:MULTISPECIES: mechanosensitive ion channel domain-containing protein [unclassified Flavobacterium]MBE0393309.1 putative MscS family protein.1 [Flavobacterium sp. PL002]NRS90249.1 small-conductance mechanosensitive channel [Flavobacterium sp. 7E]NRT14634.1 small-conductance mechanosensitive channel [Flavobacterium sp. 28A]
MEQILYYTLIKIGAYNLQIISILKLIAFILIILITLKVIRKAIYRIDKIDVGKKYSIYNLIKYLVTVVAIIIGLEMFGFNLSVLVAGSAALLVGVGLGLQNLFSDFISGIILLVDSSVKVNDVLESNGLVCIVKEINMRTTTVLTRDDKFIILPNSDLTRNQLINWTHSDITSRFDVAVGVDYTSDVDQVMLLLKQAIDEQEGVLKEPKPFVRFNDFGDSSLDFGIYFWSEDVFRVENRKSELRVRIFQLFKKHNITIPFPQRVVHISK